MFFHVFIDSAESLPRCFPRPFWAWTITPDHAKMLPRASQDAPQGLPRRPQSLTRRCQDASRGSQYHPKGSQDARSAYAYAYACAYGATKTSPEAPKGPQEAPRDFKEAPKRLSRGCLEPPRASHNASTSNRHPAGSEKAFQASRSSMPSSLQATNPTSLQWIMLPASKARSLQMASAEHAKRLQLYNIEYIIDKL